MKKTISILSGALLLSVLGCQSSQKKEMDTDQLNLALPEKWANTQEVEAYHPDWLDSFKDPGLKKLVLAARKDNLDLRLAAENVVKAKAIVQQAGSQMRPFLGLSAGGARSGLADSPSSTGASSFNAGLQAQWELDIWGRIRDGKSAASYSLESAKADFLYTQHSIAAATCKAYFMVIEANQQANTTKELVGLLEKVTDIIKIQHESGMVSAQDLSLAKSDLSAAKENLTAVLAGQREAIRGLELLIGDYPSGSLKVSQTFPTLPSPPSQGVPSDLLSRRPDIVAALLQVEAAFKNLEVAKKAKLPSLSLTSNLGGSSSSLKNILNPANVAWQVGTGLLAILYDGGLKESQVKIATAEQKQTLIAYRKTALQAFSEVENQLDQGSVLVKRKMDLTDSYNQIKKAYGIADLRYKEGEIPLVELLGVQQRLISAKSKLVSIDRLLLQQRVDLYLALGGNW